MTDNYLGNFRLKSESRIAHKRHLGMLRIEDDAFVFLYDNGNEIEIKLKEIDSVVPYKKQFNRPLITLKDKRKFIFCITPSSNWATFNRLGGQIDQRNQMRRGNKEVINTLNYMIKKLSK